MRLFYLLMVLFSATYVNGYSQDIYDCPNTTCYLASNSVVKPLCRANNLRAIPIVTEKRACTCPCIVSCQDSTCNLAYDSIVDPLCHANKSLSSIPIIVDGEACTCACYNSLSVVYDAIPWFRKISSTFGEAKSMRLLVTKFRTKMNASSVKGLLIDMKEDLTLIQQATTESIKNTPSKKVINDAWEEIHEYIDITIKINPAADNKIHDEAEHVLQLIESLAKKIPNALSELETELFIEIHEYLKRASESTRNKYLADIKKLHDANQELLKLN